MTALSPTDLLDLCKTGLVPQSAVAYDTETSGLYADDGARVSTVSVAWVDAEGEWLDFAADKKEMTWAIEEYAPDQYAPIVSVAWPFDQGLTGKPEDRGQEELPLFDNVENLDEKNWTALLHWLQIVGGKSPALTHQDRVEADLGLICHNALFDVLMMDAGCRRWPGLTVNLLDQIVWDTQNGNHMLWPLQKHPETGFPTTSLKPTCQVLFGTDAGDEARVVKAYLKKMKLPTGRWDLIPWSIIGKYADKDARLTMMLKLRQEWEIQQGTAGQWIGTPDAVMEKLNRRLEVMKILTRMEMRGLPYPEVDSRDAADACLAVAQRVAEDLPFSPTLPQAKKFFFGEGMTDRGVRSLNYIPYGLTEKGEPSMTAEIVERMVADEVPFAKQWAEYNKVTNAASMWYTAYADAMGTDGRLRTRFRQNGTASSRFSVERVNLQAIPQDYRLSAHAVLDGIPTPRRLIANAIETMGDFDGWELDLAQAELRVAALFAGCDKMLGMIVNNEDLHRYTTRELFPSVPEDHPDFKSKWRQVGKRGNFSLGFGSGGNTFRKMISKETGIDLGESLAEKIVVDWNRLYPEFSRAIDKHSAVVSRRQVKHGQGWVDLVTGERRWFQKYEDVHKAFNQRVQGNLAQFGQDWMIQSDAFLREHGLDRFGAGLLLTIHDSQVLLLPKGEEGEQMVKQIQQFGLDLWDRMFPGVPGGVDAKRWQY